MSEEDNKGFAVPGKNLETLFLQLAETGNQYVNTAIHDHIKELVTDFLDLDFSNNKYGFYILDEDEYTEDMDNTQQYYFFDEEAVLDFIDDFIGKQINKDLMSLAEEGLIEYMWDDNKNDFVFKITDKGKDIVE